MRWQVAGGGSKNGRRTCSALEQNVRFGFRTSARRITHNFEKYVPLLIQHYHLYYVKGNKLGADNAIDPFD